VTDRNEVHDGDRKERREEKPENELRRLLEEAGPRPEVPSEHLAAIKSAFRAEWARQVHSPQREPRRREPRPHQPWLRGLRGLSPRLSPALLALAATVLVAALLTALGLGWWWLGSAAGPESVARVERVEGAVSVYGPGGGTPLELARREGAIPTGAEVRTGTDDDVPGRAALRLASGSSVRFDTGSRARLLSATAIELDRGAVYLDTGGPRGGDAVDGSGVEIRTPLGVVRDLGTQFEVRLLPTVEGGEEKGEKTGEETLAALRVRVREGRVDLRWDGSTDAADAGVELLLHADGRLDRSRIASHGPGWDWVLQVAPGFDIEGRTVDQFLRWVARETGWEIRYADPSLARSARAITLHGAMGPVTPDQAPGVALPGAGLTSEVVDGTLVVSRRQP